jgi:hypothetical protein
MKSSINLELLNSAIPSNIDLFIFSASFENRCFSITQSITNNNFIIMNSLICFVEDLYQVIIANAELLKKSLGANAKTINLNTNFPFKNAIKFNEEVDAILCKDRIENVVLDASTFTHENLLIIYWLLIQKKEKFKNLYVCYVSSSEYDTNQPDISKKWLSWGVSSIRSIIGYPGAISPARKNHLIVLFGFELERTKTLINHLQFESLSLGFGAKDDSVELSHYDINYERHSELLKKYVNAHSFEFSLTDPNVAKNQIMK